MELEGMIIRDLGETGGTSTRTGNPWRKHEYVLETLGQFPRKVKFDVFGDRCSTLTFEMGKKYVVQVDAESREYNERWYTDLRAYAARESVDGGNTDVGQRTTNPGPESVNSTDNKNFPPVDLTNGGGSDEDLPF